jgi:Flp pilus assembly protein TadB
MQILAAVITFLVAFTVLVSVAFWTERRKAARIAAMTEIQFREYQQRLAESELARRTAEERRQQEMWRNMNAGIFGDGAEVLPLSITRGRG